MRWAALRETRDTVYYVCMTACCVCDFNIFLVIAWLYLRTLLHELSYRTYRPVCGLSPRNL